MSGTENLTPSSVLKRIAKELTHLDQSPPEGIQPIINEDNIGDVQAWIQGPVGTPFAGGVFRVQLKLGPHFPQAPPKGYFLTKIFHPNISPSGQICVNTLKKDWTSTSSLEYVFLTIKSLLFTPNPDSALNEEAAKLFHEDMARFQARAAVYTQVHAVSNAARVQFKTPAVILSGSGSASASSKAGGSNGASVLVGVRPQAAASVRGSSPPAGSGEPGDQVLGASNGGFTSPKSKPVSNKRPASAMSKLELARADKKRTLRRL
ncbi:hypothetical protein HDV00_008276 [Rhizophlyctis rosea]|nr:hypothetical protein HDV00_008276 [Rhizophlyctis rosea]